MEKISYICADLTRHCRTNERPENKDKLMHNIVNNNNSIFDDIDTSKWLSALTNYRSDIHNAMRNLAIQLILALLFEDSNSGRKYIYN